ncbi:MAG: HD domain-containing protein [Candidatus Melainabacteria bacterium]|nr:HD domain-containing protein [Candidatus Melainabacteria bacterium]
MNYKSNYKQRTYLDPIHGPIQLNLNDPTDNLLAQIIDTKEFQRLRRVRQMGSACFTFHGAEHTRFGHSLGALFIAKKMVSHLSNFLSEINDFKTEIFTCALLHDIGHGPFSHTAEKLTGLAHENWTKKIISGNSEVNSLLKAFRADLPEKIIKIFEYNASPLYLSQIISGYIDCDRLDYLHRDSFFVGVPYGLTGEERIISSLEIDPGRGKVTSPLLVINETIGLDAVIHYLHARYSMYQQVYQHKKNLSCDFLLRKICNRIKETCLKNTSQSLHDWLNPENRTIEKINLDSYLLIDDYSLTTFIQNLACDSQTDTILKDLSNRFMSRKLFKSLEFRQEITKDKINDILEKIRLISKAKGIDPDYYLGTEQSGTKPYEPYQVTGHKTGKAIFIKQQNGNIKELSEISGLVKALSQENIVKTCLIFKPELEDEIKNTKGFQELFK